MYSVIVKLYDDIKRIKHFAEILQKPQNFLQIFYM